MAQALPGGSEILVGLLASTASIASGPGTEGPRLWGAFLRFIGGKMKERIFPFPSLHQKLGYGAINPSLSGTCRAALARGSPSSHLSPRILARQKQQLFQGWGAQSLWHSVPGRCAPGRGRGSGWVVACSGVSAPHLSWTAPARCTPAPTARGAAGPSRRG